MSIKRDVAFAWRLFRRQPGVIGLAIGGLAFGVGVSASVFALIGSVIFWTSGVTDPASVVRVALLSGEFTKPTGDSRTQGNWTLVDYDHLREGVTTMSLTAAADVRRDLHLESNDPAMPLLGKAVSGDYLQLFGAKAVTGRLLAPSDDVAGAPPVVVISYALWRNVFGGAEGVVGRSVLLGDRFHTVVGITARSFGGVSLFGMSPTPFWIPIHAAADEWLIREAEAKHERDAWALELGRRSRTAAEDVTYAQLQREALEPIGQWNPPIDAVARLRPGTSRAAAGAEAMARAVALAPDRQRAAGVRVELQPLVGLARGSVAVIAIVATAIALVLAIAAANLAHVLLAGTVVRVRELAIRTAMGATAGRIGRQLLTEALLVGLAGGVSGVVLAWWLIPVLGRFANVPVAVDVSPDRSIIVFSIAVAVLTSAAASLWPLRLLRRWHPSASLRADQMLPRRLRPTRTRSMLIAGQAAASVAVLAIAALLTRSVIHATSTDLGFDSNRLLSASVGYPRGYDEAIAQVFLDAAVAHVASQPDIEGVSAALAVPFGDGSYSSLANGRRVYFNATTPGHFGVVGARVLRGRIFSADEARTGAAVSVISEGLSRAFWPGEDPLGSTLDRVWGSSNPFDPSTKPGDIRVVGVVSDVVMGLRNVEGLAIYRPLKPSSIMAASLLVRTRGAAEASQRAVARSLNDLTRDPGFTLRVGVVDQNVAKAFDGPRRLAWFAIIVAAAALGLAAMGVFGVTMFVVRQREHEIGIRLALGAEQPRIVRMLFRDALGPLGFGLVAGLALAFVLGQSLRQWLYGISSQDPYALTAAVGVLLLAAGAAIAVPARRASRVDAARLLREP